ncbi:MAG: ABC transporter permease [Promethearchaeota archaeon]
MTSENKSRFRIISMVKKEVKLFRTDFLNFTITLVIPPIIVAFLALTNLMAVTAPNLQVVVVIQDNQVISTPYSGESQLANFSSLMIQAIDETKGLNLFESFNVSVDPHALSEAREFLISRDVDAIIIIPSDFSENIVAKKMATVSSIIDSSDTKDTQRRLNLLQDSVDHFRSSNDLEPVISFNVEEYFQVPNYDQNKAEYRTMIIDNLPFIVFAIALIPSVLIVVREKPLKRLLLTPLSKAEVLTAKYITYTFLLVVQALMMFVVVTGLMGLHVEGNLLNFYLAILLVGYPGVTLGMIISIVSESSGEANQLYVAVLVINIMLSGMFIPYESMPSYLQTLSIFLPLTHGPPILEQVITKGTDLSLTNFNVFSLVFISLACILFSYGLFLRKKYQV